jgi:TetR/AcrR family transcriptional regulator, mexCD-oprJ operon repressor
MYQTESISTATERQLIEQAAAVLAEGRGRTMQEIADLSGVGRTTLYRHFRTREDLLRAIRVQALADVRATIVESRLDQGDADAALRRVIEGFLGVGHRYRVLVGEGPPKDEEMDTYADLTAALIGLVERGQREGVFTPALTARWIVTALGSLIAAAIREVKDGELARNHAADAVAETILGGIWAPGR